MVAGRPGIRDRPWAPLNSGSSREEALTKLRDELQYRIELCPCSGVSGDTVVLQVQEEVGRP